MYRLLVFVATGLDPKTLLWLEEHTMSVEIFKDDRLHKIHFPVQIRVRTCTLSKFIQNVQNVSLCCYMYVHVAYRACIYLGRGIKV